MPHKVYNWYHIKAQHSQSSDWSIICSLTLNYCSKLDTVSLIAIIFTNFTWQLSHIKNDGLRCFFFFLRGGCSTLYFCFLRFSLLCYVLPPPHRRHLAKSLPVPRGRIATGGCLTTLAFSVE